MQGEIERSEWRAYFDDFSKRNRGRATRVQLLSQEMGVQEEALLPLVGVAFDEKGSDGPAVEIMLGGDAASGLQHLTHTITQVERVMPKADPNGREEALEIEATNRENTLLVFQS